MPQPRRRFTDRYAQHHWGWRVYDELGRQAFGPVKPRQVDARAAADQIEARWRRRCAHWQQREHAL